MTRQPTRSLLLAALYLASILSSGSLCQLDKPDQLKPCVQDVLNQYRPQLAARFDPLRLPNHSGSSGRHSFWLSSIRIDGASTIQIRHVELRPVSSTRALILLSIYWPHLQANMNAKARLCKKILWRKRCITLRGRPQISVRSASASLTTTWSTTVVGGRLFIVPSNTRLTIHLGSIHLNPRLKGLAGFIYRLFGSFAKRFVNGKVREAWNKQRSRVEAKLSKSIEDLINKHVGPALSKVMRGKIPIG